MKFTKMHGTGNDYVYVDCTRGAIPEPEALARRISDRHFGVGSDGLVLILPGERADFRMRMYNADGSEGLMCGNAARCVGKYVYERGLTGKRDLTLETASGVRSLHLNLREGRVASVRVDMGAPSFRAEEIPADVSAFAAEEVPEELRTVPLEIEGRLFRVTCVSMGNPHCVVFQDGAEEWDIEHWGPLFENARAFPERVNTEFVRVEGRNRLRLRVWERGSGETMACGTGACAALAAAAANGRTERRATVELRGGALDIEWDEKTGHVFMTGPAEFVFEGELL